MRKARESNRSPIISVSQAFDKKRGSKGFDDSKSNRDMHSRSVLSSMSKRSKAASEVPIPDKSPRNLLANTFNENTGLLQSAEF